MKDIYCVIKVYEQLIAEVTVIRDAIENAHLNVRGSNFYSYHLLFEQVGNDLDSAITVDELGERIGALDVSYNIPVSTLKAVNSSKILQSYGDIPVSHDGYTLNCYLINAIKLLVNLLCESSQYLTSLCANTDANKLQEYEYKISHLLYLLQSQC